MSLAGCQIIIIDHNFHLQKSLEIFYRHTADKIHSKHYKGVNLPCLMPIRVETQNCLIIFVQYKKNYAHSEFSRGCKRTSSTFLLHLMEKLPQCFPLATFIFNNVNSYVWHISINVVWHYHSQIMQAKYLICQLPLETFFQKCQSKFESGQVEGSFLIRTMYLDLKFYSNLVSLSVLS